MPVTTPPDLTEAASSAAAATRPVCLVLMPMYAGFEDIRAAVARAIGRAGMEMRRLEVEIVDSAWHLWLLDSIDAADLVLVDLTGHNPFVMYELGYVHRRQLPTAFIVNVRDGRVPATVRGAVCLPYGERDDGFEADLADHLLALRASRPAAPARGAASPPHDAGGLFREACLVADRLDARTDTACTRVERAEFEARLEVACRRGPPMPSALPRRARARCLLSLLIEDSDRVEVMRRIGEFERADDPAHSG